MDSRQVPSFLQQLQDCIVQYWDMDSMSDLGQSTFKYKDVAENIERMHILFEKAGIQKGDKIALCGRNSSRWGIAFFSILTYGAVAVPILHEFHPSQVHDIVNHSSARLLFVGDRVWPTLQASEMPELKGIISLADYGLLVSNDEAMSDSYANLDSLFASRHPDGLDKENLCYHKDEAEELAIINYTSGTTGFSKGVMLPYRAIWGNLDFCIDVLGDKFPAGSNILSILPMAHMYGMMVEFIFPFVHGCHLFFLTRLPSPAIIAQAFSEVKPAVVISVPLVVDKIIRKYIFPRIQNNKVKLLWNMPVINKKVKERICQIVMEVFGGNAYEVMTGGAALNQEIEKFLKSIDFPITSGYGATECAPLITYSDWKDFIPGSCGTPVKHMEVKILSPDPENIPGEIVARGVNVMLGYYKNPEATAEVLDKDGWYHSGDLATMSADGHVFIRGRIKNMLLGANGQNVYPEEIEDKLNSMAMVNESLILQKGDKLVALVYPDFEEAKTMGFNETDIMEVMEQNRKELNAQLPPFCSISAVKIHNEEFAKTPKKSIKRYLYKDVL